MPGTYYHAILAREFVKPDRVGLAVVLSTPLFVAMVEKVVVVVIGVVSSKDIGDEFHE